MNRDLAGGDGRRGLNAHAIRILEERDGIGVIATWDHETGEIREMKRHLSQSYGWAWRPFMDTYRTHVHLKGLPEHRGADHPIWGWKNPAWGGRFIKRLPEILWGGQPSPEITR
mgnify:CR=1 FL=1